MPTGAPFAKRFAERDRGIHPTMILAGVLHRLKAVEARHRSSKSLCIFSYLAWLSRHVVSRPNRGAVKPCLTEPMA